MSQVNDHLPIGRFLLVHEYMEDSAAFAEALKAARQFSLLLVDTYNQLRDYAEQRMSVECLPPPLVLPEAI